VLKLILLILFIFLINELAFSQKSVPSLFNILPNQQSNSKLSTSNKADSAHIEINFDVLHRIRNNQINNFRLILFNGKEYLVSISRVIDHFNGDWSVTGYLDNSEFKTFTLSHSQGRILASIENHVINEHYKVSYLDKNNRHVLIKLKYDREKLLACGVTGMHKSNVISKYKPKLKNNLNEEGEIQTVIDLMVIYTKRAREWAESNGGIQNIINQSIAKGQVVLDNSEVDIAINLIYSKEVPYEESELSGGNPDTDINRLIASPDFNPYGPQYSGYLDEVHQMRDEFDADLVSFLINTDQVGGLAPVLNDVFGDARFGFSLTRVQQADTYSHIHEIGHNFGNGHSRLQNTSSAGPFGGLFLYSTGWRWLGNGGIEYSSVMTYAEGARTVPFYSNPNINFQGVPTGSYTGDGAPADNARGMQEIKKIISEYRIPSAAPIVETGQIINITAGQAEGVGIVNEEKGNRITERGMCWSKQINPDIFDSCTTAENPTDNFNVILSGLQGNTTYFARAYAKNENATGYGQNVTFTTFDISFVNSKVKVSKKRILANGKQNSQIEIILRNSINEPIIDVEVIIRQEGNSLLNPVNKFTDSNGKAKFYITNHNEESVTYQVLAKDMVIGLPFTIEFVADDNLVLGNNFPNPFNDKTNIPLVITEKSQVKIEIFNINGAKISTLINRSIDAGYYEFTFNSSNYSSGVYIYQLSTNGIAKSKKMLLIK